MNTLYTRRKASRRIPCPQPHLSIRHNIPNATYRVHRTTPLPNIGPASRLTSPHTTSHIARNNCHQTCGIYRCHVYTKIIESNTRHATRCATLPRRRSQRQRRADAALQAMGRRQSPTSTQRLRNRWVASACCTAHMGHGHNICPVSLVPIANMAKLCLCCQRSQVQR